MFFKKCETSPMASFSSLKEPLSLGRSLKGPYSLLIISPGAQSAKSAGIRSSKQTASVRGVESPPAPFPGRRKATGRGVHLVHT